MRAATTLLYVNLRCCTGTYRTNPATVSSIFESFGPKRFQGAALRPARGGSPSTLRNHRRGGPSGLATPIFSLSSLEPKSLRMVILTIILVQVLCCIYQSPKHYIEIWHERPFSLQSLSFMHTYAYIIVQLLNLSLSYTIIYYC